LNELFIFLPINNRVQQYHQESKHQKENTFENSSTALSVDAAKSGYNGSSTNNDPE